MNNFLQSIIDRDPAAKSKLSLILTYPGVKAVFFHKIANFFYLAKFDLVARFISQLSRFLTGIEIHPGAKIGIQFSIKNQCKNTCKKSNSISWVWFEVSKIKFKVHLKTRESRISIFEDESNIEISLWSILESPAKN